ncbi:DUF6973 domain-containing protein [Bergeyella porcorum]|uniref:DUF6973 domain-containing protein n=1 Tax=Bergeyella porcorum TaxID=1735111 RepID=UPI0035EAE755
MKPIIIFIRAIKSLSFQKVITLLSLVLKHPLFSILSFYATLKTFALAKKFFPKTNSNSGIGNAFRHALWCCLIPMYCCKISSPKKSLDFCKKITDLHEELFPNEPLEKKMDLHNNTVGMILFEEMLKGIHRQFFETQFFVEELFKKVKTAKVLNHISEDHGDSLVYIDETQGFCKKD